MRYRDQAFEARVLYFSQQQVAQFIANQFVDSFYSAGHETPPGTWVGSISLSSGTQRCNLAKQGRASGGGLLERQQATRFKQSATLQVLVAGCLLHVAR
jgi:hypothetical protein